VIDSGRDTSLGNINKAVEEWDRDGLLYWGSPLWVTGTWTLILQGTSGSQCKTQALESPAWEGGGGSWGVYTLPPISHWLRAAPWGTKSPTVLVSYGHKPSNFP